MGNRPHGIFTHLFLRLMAGQEASVAVTVPGADGLFETLGKPEKMSLVDQLEK